MLDRAVWIGAVVVLGTTSAPGAEVQLSPAAPDTSRNEQLFPHGWQHYRRCWQLEHDYYALPERIAKTWIVWLRQQLQLEWEAAREERLQNCLMGW